VLLNSSYWSGLIDWVRGQVLARGLISAQDFDCISIVDTPEAAFKVISEHHQRFREGHAVHAAPNAKLEPEER